MSDKNDIELDDTDFEDFEDFEDADLLDDDLNLDIDDLNDDANSDLDSDELENNQEDTSFYEFDEQDLDEATNDDIGNIDDGDDDWDDLDDDEQDAPAPTNNEKTKSSSFVTFALIGLIAAVGGGYAYLQFGSASQESSTTQQTSGILPEQALSPHTNDTDLASAPPMPSALTTPDDNQLFEDPLSSEGIDLEPDQSSSPEEILQATPNEIDLQIEQIEENVLTPLPVEDLANIELPPLEPLEDLSEDVFIDPAAQVPDEVRDVDVAEPVFNETQDKPVDDAPAKNSVEDTAPNNAIEMQELQNKYDAQLRNMEAQIDNRDAKIAMLQSQINDLQSKLSVSQAQEEKKIASDLPIKTNKPPVKIKKTVSRKTNKAIRWTLKTAQPGKAGVSASGSNDIRFIEVGDKLAGIGTIKSISVVNGRWVVQGSQGRILQ